VYFNVNLKPLTKLINSAIVGDRNTYSYVQWHWRISLQ